MLCFKLICNAVSTYLTQRILEMLCVSDDTLGLIGVQKVMLVRTPAVVILWNKPLGKVLIILYY